MDVIFVGISATMDFRELRMHNFAGEYLQVMGRASCGCTIYNEKHPHVIENVGCRCKICEESILKYQKGQDVDAI